MQDTMVQNSWNRVFLFLTGPLFLKTLFSLFGIASTTNNFGMANETFSTADCLFEKDSTVLLDNFIPTASYHTNQSSLFSKKCIQDSQLVARAILNQTEWALSSKLICL